MSRSRSSTNTGRDEPSSASARYAAEAKRLSSLSFTASLFAAPHLDNLSNFLCSPFDLQPIHRSQSNASREEQSHKIGFVSYYKMTDSKGPERVECASIEAFENAFNSQRGASADVIFTRGMPSPQWLNSIGSKLSLDYNFINQHLDLRFALTKADKVLHPPLPSASKAMLRLRFTTIAGSDREPRKQPQQRNIDKLRKRSHKELESYREAVRKDHNVQLGDSIIRDVTILDEEHFTFEQDISVCVLPSARGWTAFIWSDFGNDLGSGSFYWLLNSLTPEDARIVKIFPTPNGIKPRRDPTSHAPTMSDDSATIKNPQSASRMHLDYGASLHPLLASRDSFYAVHELFAVAAASESGFLNLMDSKIAVELDPDYLESQENLSLTNVLCKLQALDRHTQKIKETIQSINERHGPEWRRDKDWFKNNNNFDNIAEAAAKELHRDFSHLLQRAEYLMQKCDRAIQLVMQHANLRESKRAIEQAEGLAKLTRLAFVFIPLSFTASFFGMNFLQLGTGKLPIWVWFAISLPVLIVSVALMSPDTRNAVRRRLLRRRTQEQDPSGGV